MHIPGAAFPGKSPGKIVGVNWHEVPAPAWNRFSLSDYLPSAHRYTRLPSLPVFMSRACPYLCDFCPESLYNSTRKYNLKPAELVLKEIRILVETYGIKEVEFYDPTFAFNRRETEKLCALLSESDLDITWTCYTRCDLLDEDLLSKMYLAGCRCILFGVESGDARVLGRTGKNLSFQSVRETVQLCKKYKIRSIASFILGLPMDTSATLMKTIQLAISLDPDYAQFHPAISYFAHDEWNRLGRVDHIRNISGTGFNGMPFIPQGLSSFAIKQYLLRAYLQFYIRPRKILQLLKQVVSLRDIFRLLSGLRQVVRAFVRI